jgi:hypothetical protein
MSDGVAPLTYNIIGPIELAWDASREQLSLRGRTDLEGQVSSEILFSIQGDDAIKTLTQFQALLQRIAQDNDGPRSFDCL